MMQRGDPACPPQYRKSVKCGVPEEGPKTDHVAFDKKNYCILPSNLTKQSLFGHEKHPIKKYFENVKTQRKC